MSCSNYDWSRIPVGLIGYRTPGTGVAVIDPCAFFEWCRRRAAQSEQRWIERKALPPFMDRILDPMARY